MTNGSISLLVKIGSRSVSSEYLVSNVMGLAIVGNTVYAGTKISS